MRRPVDRSGAGRVRPLPTLLAGLGLLVCTNGPVLVATRIHRDRSAGLETPAVRVWFVAVAVVAAGALLVALARGRGDLSRTSPRGLAAVVGFLAVIGGSTLWSVDRSLTLSRALIYVGLGGLAWWVGASPTVDRRGAVLVMAVLGVGVSVVTWFGWRHVAVQSVDGSLRGLYTGRNSLAPIAGIGVLAGASLAVERGRRVIQAAGAAFALVSLVVLVATDNKTSPISLAVALAVPASIVAVARVGRDRGRGAGRSGAVGLVLLAAALAWPVVDAVWSTGTFDTRRRIWDLVRDRIAERPLEGFGFSVLWDTPAYAASMYDAIGTVFGSAHNSWLELWLGAGVLGVVAYTVLVASALLHSLRDFRNAPSPTSAFWLALVCFLALENLTESFVLWYSYNWVLLAAAAVRRPAPRFARSDGTAGAERETRAQSRLVSVLSPDAPT